MTYFVTLSNEKDLQNYKAPLKIDEDLARSLLSCMSLKLSLTPYAERNFPQHIRKSRGKYRLMKRGLNFEDKHNSCAEVPKWMQRPQPNHLNHVEDDSSPNSTEC